MTSLERAPEKFFAKDLRGPAQMSDENSTKAINSQSVGTRGNSVGGTPPRAEAGSRLPNLNRRQTANSKNKSI